jgi:pyruvate dehydrogenase E1 component alpha subunit
MEMQTYRYRGHSMSDPAKYRSKEEVATVRKESDPIDNLRSYMIEKGYADEAAFKEIDREVKEIVNQAAEFSQQSPEPDPSELYTDVLVAV